MLSKCSHVARLLDLLSCHSVQCPYDMHSATRQVLQPLCIPKQSKRGTLCCHPTTHWMTKISIRASHNTVNAWRPPSLSIGTPQYRSDACTAVVLYLMQPFLIRLPVLSCHPQLSYFPVILETVHWRIWMASMFAVIRNALRL